MANKPGFSATLAVSDASETQVVVNTYCSAILAAEQVTSSGWPRNYLVRLPSAGSAQIAQLKASTFRFQGPFQPGDVAGKIELVSNGGDTSTFVIQEITEVNS